MRMPVLFECPSCGKKHYIAFCSGSEGPRPCGSPFVSIFFPSGSDARCAKHRGKPKAGSAPVPEIPDTACPTTREPLDLEALEKDPRLDPTSPGAPKRSVAPLGQSPAPSPQAPRPPPPAPSGNRPVVPPTASAAPPRPTPPVVQRPLEATDSGIAEPSYSKCPSCFVIFDRNRNERCPRCGGSPDQAKRQLRDAPSKAVESLNEELAVLLLTHWKVLAGVLGGSVLALGLLGAVSSSAIVTALSLIGVVIAMLAGMSGAVAYFRVSDVPYYRNLLAERERGEGPKVSLFALLRSVATKTPIEAAATEASAAAVEAGDAPEGGLPEADFPTDLAAGGEIDADSDSAASGVTRPWSAATVRARYAGGHPLLARGVAGRLVFDEDALRFESARGGFTVGRSAVETASLSRLGVGIALLLAVAVIAASFVLLPGSVGSHRMPTWVPWGPAMLGYLEFARRAAQVAAGLLVALLLMGLVRAPHVSLAIRFRDGEARRRMRFRMNLFAARRISAAGVSG